MNGLLDAFASGLQTLLARISVRAQRHRMRKYPYIARTVYVGPTVRFIGPATGFHISERTYINDAILTAGKTASISIGSRCAIGYRVSIKAVSHDPHDPCPEDDGSIETVERSITIGNSCWIGDNVFIREGVTLGDNVIVGANSVVLRSFPSDVVIAGCPAAIVRHRDPSPS